MASEVRVRARVRPKNGQKFILVANSKGGCGKSTLATNLAAAYARLGFSTALVDADSQRSALTWLEMRPGECPPITGLSGCQQAGRPLLDWVLRVPPDTSRVVIDSPGGMRDHQLFDFIRKADDILVPVLPSAVDIRATTEYLKEIFISPEFRRSEKRLFVIGNRVEKRNKYFHQLRRFLKQMNSQNLIILPESYVVFAIC